MYLRLPLLFGILLTAFRPSKAAVAASKPANTTAPATPPKPTTSTAPTPTRPEAAVDTHKPASASANSTPSSVLKPNVTSSAAPKPNVTSSASPRPANTTSTAPPKSVEVAPKTADTTAPVVPKPGNATSPATAKPSDATAPAVPASTAPPSTVVTKPGSCKSYTSGKANLVLCLEDSTELVKNSLVKLDGFMMNNGTTKACDVHFKAIHTGKTLSLWPDWAVDASYEMYFNEGQVTKVGVVAEFTQGLKGSAPGFAITNFRDCSDPADTNANTKFNPTVRDVPLDDVKAPSSGSGVSYTPSDIPPPPRPVDPEAPLPADIAASGRITTAPNGPHLHRD